MNGRQRAARQRGAERAAWANHPARAPLMAAVRAVHATAVARGRRRTMQVTYAAEFDAAGAGDIARAAAAAGRLALVTGLEPDEPVFVLRARDAFALAVLNHYRQISEGLFEGDRALALEADVQAMIDWRRAHQAIVRDPD